MRFLVIFLFLVSGFQIFAEISPVADAQTLYQKGIKAYQEQKFKEAQQNFSKAFEINQNNKFILHNWALTEFQLDNKGMAVAAWRRSLFIDPTFTTASNALQWAVSQLPSGSSLGNASSWEKFRTSILNKVSLTQTLICTLLLFVLSLSLLIKYFAKRYHALKSESPLPKFPTPAVILSLMLLVSAVTSLGKIFDSYETRATIISKTVNMRTGPSQEDNSLFELLEGAEVIVERINKSWSQVTYPGGFTGWVPNDSLFFTSGKNI